MAYEYAPTDSTVFTSAPTGNEQMDKLLREKKAARDYQQRKYLGWDDNYELYRNKVKTNRLTQRQTVNIPLMKETIKTLLSKIDDPPSVEWKELGGDEEKQIVVQEMWNDDADRLNFEGIDIQDKKTVMLYGRGFKKLNWTDKGFDIQALDIYDVVVDPMVDPLDLETARFVIHQNIFRSLRTILADERYSQAGKDALKIWATSREGVVQTSKNKVEWEKKLTRLKAMGIESSEFPLFAAGDVIVNLSEHISDHWNTTNLDWERRVYVYADDKNLLMDDLLKDNIGVEFYPFVSWGDDIEANDFWSDGIGDLVRVPNKILNIWFSQLVENRTLRNFQMHWYDATIQGYQPQTYEPGQGRMLPAPGDPNKTIMPVAIDGLDETLQAIEFLTGVIERASAATALTKGEQAQNTTTLGEVQLALGQANERVLSMAKFYRRSWLDLANKWMDLNLANTGSGRKLYKTGSDGKIYPRTVYPKDWKSKAGYKATVSSSSEQETNDIKDVQKFQFILGQFPQNPALLRIAQRRMLQIVKLTPEEIKEVQDAETQKHQMEMEAAQNEQANAGNPPAAGAPPVGAPPAPDMNSALAPRVKELMKLVQ